MGKHLHVTELKTTEGVRKVYSTPSHVQRIETEREGPMGKLVSVLDFGNNRVGEVIRYFPSNSAISTVTYKRKHVGRNPVTPRAEAALHLTYIEDLFRNSFPEQTSHLPAYQI